ncbi:hypothetical protein HDU93_004862 [Gonapodya sp. JEL0774]|nr:hypothetical protein HDU93_004862 [Gonapodya sp. JEL0774]
MAAPTIDLLKPATLPPLPSYNLTDQAGNNPQPQPSDTSISAEILSELISLRAQVVSLRSENDALKAAALTGGAGKHASSATTLHHPNLVLTAAEEVAKERPFAGHHADISASTVTLHDQVAYLKVAHMDLLARVQELERNASQTSAALGSGTSKQISFSPSTPALCPFVSLSTAEPQADHTGSLSRRKSGTGSSMTSAIRSIHEAEDESSIASGEEDTETSSQVKEGDATATMGSTRRRSSRSSIFSRISSSSAKKEGTLGHSLDWNSLVESKKACPWKELTVDVSKQQMELVISSWSSIKKDGLVDKLGKSAMECLFSQNPAYKRLYPDPSAFPLAGIVERIVAHSKRSFGKNQLSVVTDILLLGWKHQYEMGGIGLNDFKRMVVAVTYGITDVRNIPYEEKQKEILAWQVLLREISVIMARGGEMDKAEIVEVKRNQASKGKTGPDSGEDKNCKVM